MKAPNRKLVGAVLGYKVESVSAIAHQRTFNVTGNTEKYTPKVMTYNIYEFMNLVKEWKLDNGYYLQINIIDLNTKIRIKSICNGAEIFKTISGITEFEAVVKAGEWVLKELNDD